VSGKKKRPTEEYPSSNSGLFTPEPRTGSQSDLGLADFNLSKGIEQLQGRRNLLIYMHDNPDPDAMAAAMGIKHLVECTTDLTATLALGGIVGIGVLNFGVAFLLSLRTALGARRIDQEGRAGLRRRLWVAFRKNPWRFLGPPAS